MSQYADGGLMTTKPYFSGSSYIRSMSNYAKGEWCEVWDGLFWLFMHKKKKQLQKNSRLRMLYGTFKRMKPGVLKEHYKNAQRFINK